MRHTMSKNAAQKTKTTKNKQNDTKPNRKPNKTKQTEKQIKTKKPKTQPTTTATNKNTEHSYVQKFAVDGATVPLVNNTVCVGLRHKRNTENIRQHPEVEVIIRTGHIDNGTQ